MKHKMLTNLGVAFVLTAAALWTMALTVAPMAIIKYCLLYLIGA